MPCIILEIPAVAIMKRFKEEKSKSKKQKAKNKTKNTNFPRDFYKNFQKIFGISRGKFFI